MRLVQGARQLMHRLRATQGLVYLFTSLSLSVTLAIQAAGHVRLAHTLLHSSVCCLATIAERRRRQQSAAGLRTRGQPNAQISNAQTFKSDALRRKHAIGRRDRLCLALDTHRALALSIPINHRNRRQRLCPAARCWGQCAQLVRAGPCTGGRREGSGGSRDGP